MRAALYCRVSSAGQEDNSSLGTQEEGCRAYAAERGWTIATVHREVHTGIDLFERPQLALLRESMRARQVDAVVCFSTDRLSRDPVHLGLVQYEATYYGIDLAFVTDAYDSTLEGQMLSMVRGIAGRIEYERLKERTRRGTQARLAKGLPLAGNKAPYGFAWANSLKTHLVANDAEAPLIAEAFQRVAVGCPVRRITRELNERGVPTSTGKGTWAPQTLLRMLRNPIYVGRRIALEREYFDEQVPGVGRKKKHRKRASGFIVMDDVAPAVVGEDVFAAVQLRLETNKARSVRNNQQPTLALLRGGFARCGYCGHALQAKSVQGARVRVQYVCPNRHQRSDCPPFAMEAHLLDHAVWERVERVLLDPEIIASELARRQQRGFDERLLRSAEGRVAQAERKRQNLVKRLSAIDDDAIAEAVQIEIGHLQLEVNAARDVFRELQREHDQWEVSRAEFEDARTRLRLVATNLANLDYDAKRLAFDALGVEAKLWESGHDPRFEVSMTLPALGSSARGTRSLVLG